jgi:hypothetical protein
VAVNVDDLIIPQGELSGDMFPGEDLTLTVGAWLTQGAAAVTAFPETVQDRALTHYVYGRAYRSIARRMALQPNSAQAEGISETIGADRIRYFDGLATAHEEAYEALRLQPPKVATRPRTQAVSNRIHF